MQNTITGEILLSLLLKSAAVIINKNDGAILSPHITEEDGDVELELYDEQTSFRFHWHITASFNVTELGAVSIPVSESIGVDVPSGSVELTLLQVMPIEQPAIMLTIEGGIIQNVTANTEIDMLVVNFDDEDEDEPSIVTHWNGSADMDLITGPFSDHIEQAITDMPDKTQQLTIAGLREHGF